MQNKDKVISVRITEDDFKILKVTAFTIGMTPSRLVRMLVDSSISATKIKIKKGEISLEDIESVLDD